MANRTHHEVENSRDGRHSDRINFFYRVCQAQERGRLNTENFTETLTSDLQKYCKENSRRDNVYVYFEYTQEGTLWVINNKWFAEAIHDFAKKYNIPLSNITYHGGSATLQETYDKWHAIYRPNEDKIKLRHTDFGLWLYDSRNSYFDILKFPEEPNKNLRTKKFNCLNANVSLQHRIAFLYYMEKNNLLDTENNYISFHYFKGMHNPIEKIYPISQELKEKLPIQFDLKGDWEQVYGKIFDTQFDPTALTDWNKTGDFSYIYDDCYFTVTTESGECVQLCDQLGDEKMDEYFREFHKEMFITEKTSRPMLYLHPQIIYSTSGTLEYLKSWGFKTFSNYWNEDYDNEQNGDKKLQMIMDVVKELNNKPIEELHEMYWDMVPILKHNQNILLNTGIEKYENNVLPLDL